MKFNRMKNRYSKTVLLFLFLTGQAGMHAAAFIHEHVNRAAVLALPMPLKTFFYNHIDFITVESTIPDIRKYMFGDKGESARHFIDIESYGTIALLPASMPEVQAKYDEIFLQKNGILPWYVQDLMTKLTKAFKDKRKTEILLLAADLAHYITDLNLPLHTCINYDGQLTDQNGIHSFWEAQIPELFGMKFNYNTGEPRQIDDIQKEILHTLSVSYKLADTLLLKEKKLSKGMPRDKIFQIDANGLIRKNKFNQVVHTTDYAHLYSAALNGMIEKQIRSAISMTADFWYTAWVDAGMPDVIGLDPEELTKSNSERLSEDLQLWKAGKLSGVQSEKEF
jgi:hypothetical protein